MEPQILDHSACCLATTVDQLCCPAVQMYVCDITYIVFFISTKYHVNRLFFVLHLVLQRALAVFPLFPMYSKYSLKCPLLLCN